MASPESRYERKKLFEQILLRIEPLLNEGRLEEASFQLALAKEIDPNSIIVRHLEERVERLKESLAPEQTEDLMTNDQDLHLARLKYEEEARRLEEQRRKMEEARQRFEEESKMFEEQRRIAEEERIKYEVDRIKKERDAQNLSELRRRADIERRKYEEEVRKYEEQTFLGQESRFKFEEELRKREERKKQMLEEQRKNVSELKKPASPSSQTPQVPPFVSEPRGKTAAPPQLQKEKITEKKPEREYLQPPVEEPVQREIQEPHPPVKKASREASKSSYEQPFSYKSQKAGKEKVIGIILTLIVLFIGGGITFYLLTSEESPPLIENPPSLVRVEQTAPETAKEKQQSQQEIATKSATIDTMVQSLFQQPDTVATPSDTVLKSSAEETPEEKEAEVPPPSEEEVKEPPLASAPPKTKDSGFPIEQEDPTLEETGEIILHTVKAGETIESISRQYKVTVRQLVKWNSLPSPKVKPKQEIYIFTKKR